MPAPAPFSMPHNQPAYPALYLYPLNDSFVPKHITLHHNQRVKIGRQTNAKTSPAERNGYFDSKVLSRQHAEVWEEGNKIYIKDVKSSNGTFINGERLSQEGLESEPFELKSDDIVEFGIDIVGEDNKTIIHHKVAARVLCVFNEQDAHVAARAEQHQSTSSLGMVGQASSSGAGSSFNFANQGAVSGPSSAQRRPMQQTGLGGMGGMGGSMRPPGKSGLTFDHILSRLQGELQKSRETGAELHSLTGAMNDIHDTLGGTLPASIPPYPQTLPPVRPSQGSSQMNGSSPPPPEGPPPASDSALVELRSQLHDTQSSLATHQDKFHALEGILAEHEAFKREIAALREMMEERKREMVIERRGSPHHGDGGREEFDAEHDDDDARSINTVVPHELERVDEEDEDQLAAEEEEEEERRRRRDELGRPRTPEPSSMGMSEEDFDLRRSNHLASHRSLSPSPQSREHPSSLIDALTQQLGALSDRLESALELSNALQSQHAAAQTTISALESKVSSLENLVEATQAQVHAQAEAPALTSMLSEWKKGVEGQWSNVQEEWSQERERLARAREEWESKFQSVEVGLGSAVAKVDQGLASISSIQAQQHHLTNGDAKHGLVTPPSPRSLSADSNRPRQRRRRSPSSRGRARSQPHDRNSGDLTDGSSTAVSVSGLITSLSSYSLPKSPNSRPSTPSDDSDMDAPGTEAKSDLTLNGAARYLATPAPSVHTLSASQSMTESPVKDPVQEQTEQMHPMNVSTALGVLVIGVAAAAVIWRVKPE